MIHAHYNANTKLTYCGLDFSKTPHKQTSMPEGAQHMVTCQRCLRVIEHKRKAAKK
jgi:hypothetical protein